MSFWYPPSLNHKSGFTLIELSIVLVIIGLIVGGILVGQDLIKAAEVRAQISQIEKYNSAVNTFRGKFQAIPGDMALATANQFGFPLSSCDGTKGKRDGNGLIDALPGTLAQPEGETGMFWMDLSSPIAGNLIDFTNGITAACSGSMSTPNVAAFFPAAKIGHGNYVYVYETSGYNWFGVSQATRITSSFLYSAASTPVIQAYQMDTKIDDGLPTTGAVQAAYLSGVIAAPIQPTNAATDDTTTCYNTTTNAYSISSLANYGADGNCALSFRFQ